VWCWVETEHATDPPLPVASLSPWREQRSGIDVALPLPTGSVPISSVRPNGIGLGLFGGKLQIVPAGFGHRYGWVSGEYRLSRHREPPRSDIVQYYIP
jgi:hypothetical protein